MCVRDRPGKPQTFGSRAAEDYSWAAVTMLLDLRKYVFSQDEVELKVVGPASFVAVDMAFERDGSVLFSKF